MQPLANSRDCNQYSTEHVNPLITQHQLGSNTVKFNYHNRQDMTTEGSNVKVINTPAVQTVCILNPECEIAIGCEPKGDLRGADGTKTAATNKPSTLVVTMQGQVAEMAEPNS